MHTFRWLLFLATLSSLQAQALVERFAGALPRSGTPEETGLRTAGTAWDKDGNAYGISSIAPEVIWKIRPDGYSEIIAGTGESGYSGDGGPATQARIAGPLHVRLDTAGNVYFVDVGNSRIRRIGLNGVITTVVGNGIPFASGMALEGLGTELAVTPSQTLELSPTGALYFGQGTGGGAVVRRMDANGQVKVVAGVVDPNCPNCSDGNGGPALQAHVSGVRSLTADSLGNVWFVDNKVLRRIDPTGRITKVMDLLGGFPGVAVNSQGVLYAYTSLSPPGFASGFERQSFMRVGQDGSTQETAQGTANGIFRDGTGRVVSPSAIVSPTTTGTELFSAEDGSLVRKYPDVRMTPSPDGTPAREARIVDVVSIDVSPDGELYFGEQVTCSIRKVDSQGKVRTVVGNDTCDGLFSVSSMVFGRDGRLWVRRSSKTYEVQPGRSITERTLPPEFGTGNTIAIDAKDRLHSFGSASPIRVELDNTALPLPRGSGPLSQTFVSDPDRNVYFVDNVAGQTSPRLVRVNDDGTVTTVMQLGASVVRNAPIDAAGRVWSGATVVDPSGTRTTLGRAPGGYSGDGVAAQSAQIGIGGATARAANGDIYIRTGPSGVGLTNARILRITGTGKTAAPVISPGGIVNSASYAGGGVAPEEIVSIFGAGFGVSGLQVATPENNRIPDYLGRLKVLIGGVAAPILAATDNVINVIVPFAGVTGKTEVEVVVQLDEMASAPVKVPVVETALHLFTANASGSGQGAILNQDYSLNSKTNPAAKGSFVVLYGTGAGASTPRQVSGALNITLPYPLPKAAFTVRIGGQIAELPYAGEAPTLVQGAFQLNVKIPLNVASGDIPVEVIGPGGATSKTVTVAVQ